MSPEELQKIVTEVVQQNTGIPWWVYLLFVILSFLGGYFGSYTKKKGENLATKEDIHEITEKIESVKATVLLGKELEKQYLDRKLQLLMDFFDHITEFHYERLTVNFGDFPSDDGKSLFEYQVEFHQSVAEILKAYQRLVVFITPGSQILHHAEQLANSVIASRQVLKKHFGEIKTTSFKEREAYISGDRTRIDAAIEEADDANSLFWGEMKPTVLIFKEYFQKFLVDLNEYVKPESEKA